MFIYVQASDYDRFLRLDVEPDELVRSIKDKINGELGGMVPEEQLDTLNYVGIIMDCSTPVRNYGVEESSLLYLGRNPHAPYTIHAPAPAMAVQGQVAASNANMGATTAGTIVSDIGGGGGSSGGGGGGGLGETLTSTQSLAQITSQPQTLSQQAQLQVQPQQTAQQQQQYYDYQQQQQDYPPQPQDYAVQQAPPLDYMPQDYQQQMQETCYVQQQQEMSNMAAVTAYQPYQYAAGYSAQQQPYYYGYPNY